MLGPIASTSLVSPQLSQDTGVRCCPSSVPSGYFQEITVALEMLQLLWGTLSIRLWFKYLRIAGSWVNTPMRDKQTGIYCKWFLWFQ